MISEVITPSDVYWITRFDGLRGLFSSVAAVAFLGSAALLIIGCIQRCETRIENVNNESWSYKWAPDKDAIERGKLLHRQLRWSIPILLVAASAQALIPTTKEAVAMVVVPKIANNEDLQGLGSEFVTMAREWMQELRPAKAVEAGK